LKHLPVVGGLLLGLLGRAAAGPVDTSPAAGVASEPEPGIRFHGLTFHVTLADGTGLNAVGHNYRNDLNLYLEPAWHAGKRFFARSRFQSLSISARWLVTRNLAGTDESNVNGSANAGPQGSCSDVSPSTAGTIDPGQAGYCNPQANDRRTDYGDLWLTARNPRVYTIPKLLVELNPAVRVILPVSAESRFETLLFSVMASLGLSRSFLTDRLSVSYTFGFTKYFHQYTTPQIDGAKAGATASQGGNASDGAFGAGISNFYSDPTRSGTICGHNPSFGFMHLFGGAYKLSRRWSFEALYFLLSSYAYGHACTVTVSGLSVDTCASGDRVAAGSGSSLSRPGHRDTQILWLTASYQALPWLGVFLSYINWAPLLYPDSSYRQPFFSTDYSAFTTIQLGATVTVEALIRKWRP